MDLSPAESVRYFIPEIVLIGAIVALFVGDLFIRRKELLGEWVALLGLAASLFATSRLAGSPDAWLFHRMVVNDQFAVFFKVVFALAAIVTVWMSLGSREIDRVDQGEYYGILLSSTLGMYVMASAS